MSDRKHPISAERRAELAEQAAREVGEAAQRAGISGAPRYTIQAQTEHRANQLRALGYPETAAAIRRRAGAVTERAAAALLAEATALYEHLPRLTDPAPDFNPDDEFAYPRPTVDDEDRPAR